MIGRLRMGVVALAALLVSPLLPAELNAQAASRFRVMVTNLTPVGDANDDFGKDLAEELRKLINELPTHQPVDEDEIEDGADRFDVKMEDLDCIRSLQLAVQINAELVLCGEYTEDKQAKTVSLSGVQFAVPGGASFAIADKTWGEKQPREAAQEIFDAFGTYVDQLRVAQFCGEYFQSKTWDSAEEQCARAIELNPKDAQVRYIYARTLMELDRNEEAYEEVKQVVELDQLHEDGLMTAGFLATTLGHREEGRKYYDTYLQLNPGDAPVRMNIAYEMAKAGDPEGGMLFVEEGLAVAPDDTDLLLMHAGLATSAAAALKGGGGESETLSPEVTALYEKALGSYEKAYEVAGAEMEANHLRNMVAAYLELGQLPEAVSMAERALETHDQEAPLWAIYADVLKRSNRLDEAIAALDAVRERDPEYPNIAARQGTWLIEAGREDEAMEYLTGAVENGEQTADAMARLLFATGHRNGVSKKDWDYAIRLIEMGKTFQPSERVAGELDFWHGYALFEQGKEQQAPQTVQTAQAALPKFQQAQRLFQQQRVATYVETQPSITLQQWLDATAQYIEIQEAIIQRGT